MLVHEFEIAESDAHRLRELLDCLAVSPGTHREVREHRPAVRPGVLVRKITVTQDVLGSTVVERVALEVLIDDILDTGRTMKHLVEHLKTLGTASVRTAVLLRKKGRQEVAIEPDFVGFEIPNEFVVGYGLDYDDEYRNLPFIGVLDGPV